MTLFILNYFAIPYPKSMFERSTTSLSLWQVDIRRQCHAGFHKLSWPPAHWSTASVYCRHWVKPSYVNVRKRVRCGFYRNDSPCDKTARAGLWRDGHRVTTVNSKSLLVWWTATS